MRFQRLTQGVMGFLFLVLLFYAAHPAQEGLPVDLFLQLDPVIGTATAITARTVSWFLLPGFAVALVAALAGRVFCGHVCPMGSTLDLAQAPLNNGFPRSAKRSSFEVSSPHRAWKYLFLAVILAAGAAGVMLAHFGSPLSLITRVYGLCVWPLAALAGEAGLDLTAEWFSAAGLSGIAYAQFPQRFYATSIFVACLFAGIVTLAYIQPRFWCRNLCPTGALLGLCSTAPVIRRRVSDSCVQCGRCVSLCPTGAIRKDPAKTVHSECIVCLRCREICPEAAVSFGVSRTEDNAIPAAALPERRAVLLAIGGGVVTGSLFRTGLGNPEANTRESAVVDPRLIRPPGSLPEEAFLTRCVRCAQCMKACPTNTIQPVWFRAGINGMFTPTLHPRLAGCAVPCNVCGRVCPTDAIREIPLVEKQHAKVGSAWIERRNCLVWEQDKKCLVCDEVCPYNAVSFRPVPGLRNAAPFVLEHRCIGCGWCEARCPVKGAAAIRINIIGEVRLAAGSYRKKAREYGLIFRSRDNSTDSLAQGTFDERDRAPRPGVTRESPSPQELELPSGFITK